LNEDNHDDVLNAPISQAEIENLWILFLSTSLKWMLYSSLDLLSYLCFWRYVL
jgi:hypothetical protein